MKPGFDPTRRNRNIGTARQGHGQDNRLVIPTPCRPERHWAEQISPDHRRITRRISSRDVLFIVEACRKNCAHACSVEDIVQVLAHIPTDDWRGLDTIILRQPTHKQGRLRPAWGRLHYAADLGLAGRNAFRHGPALILAAMDHAAELHWPTALQPQDSAELARLREDGHDIRQEGRRHILTMNPDSVRATQLYRTLPHEIGHWVDYLEKVADPAADDDERHRNLSDDFFARPDSERESFAHRYAEAILAKLTKFGIVPFDRLVGHAA